MAEILRLVSAFDSAGKDMRRLTVELMEHFRNLLVCQYVGAETMKNLDATPEQLKTLMEQAQLADAGRVMQVADQLAEMEGRLRFALSVRTLIEMTLIRCARIVQTVSLERILERLHAIRTAEPPPQPTPSKGASFSLDDPALKQALKLFDGKIVEIEDD
jgi:DNA polymerase III gamma/tau subunit